ncbi:Gustatory receptor [Sergentomyia squamirostris]
MSGSGSPVAGYEAAAADTISPARKQAARRLLKLSIPKLQSNEARHQPMSASAGSPQHLSRMPCRTVRTALPQDNLESGGPFIVSSPPIAAVRTSSGHQTPVTPIHTADVVSVSSAGSSPGGARSSPRSFPRFVSFTASDEAFYSWRTNGDHLKVLDEILELESHLPATKPYRWSNVHLTIMLVHNIILDVVFTVVNGFPDALLAKLKGMFICLSTVGSCSGSFSDEAFRLMGILTKYLDAVSAFNKAFAPLVAVTFMQHLFSCCMASYIAFYLCFISVDFPMRESFMFSYMAWGFRGIVMMIFLSATGEIFTSKMQKLWHFVNDYDTQERLDNNWKIKHHIVFNSNQFRFRRFYQDVAVLGSGGFPITNAAISGMITAIVTYLMVLIQLKQLEDTGAESQISG